MNYNGLQICGVVGEYNASGTLCRFPGKKLTWTTTGAFTGFDEMTTKSVFMDAWKAITSKCGLIAEYTPNPKTANVITNFGRIDGPGNVLAWSKVFCGGFSGQLDQLFDSGDAYSYSDSPPQGRVSAVAVATHECVHMCGIDGHLSRGNLLAPTYDPRILTLQPGDIAELVARYGLPAEQPAPPTTPFAPPPPGTITPMPPIQPNTPIDFGVLLRLLGAWGLDLAAKMTPAERAFVIDFVLRMIRSFSPQQRMEAAEAMRAAGMPITLD